MQDSYISNQNAKRISKRASKNERHRKAIVDSVNDDGTATVRFSTDSSVVANVTVSIEGDDYVPTVGEDVLVKQAAGGEYAIVGAHVVSDESKRATSAGERVLGHPSSDTNVRFTPDGDLLVTSFNDSGEAIQWEHTTDGETNVYVGGSSSPTLTIDDAGLRFADEQVVTDVSTSTDSDGHVTSVDVSYTQSISL